MWVICLLAYNFPSSDVNAQFPNEELTVIAFKTWEISLDGANNYLSGLTACERVLADQGFS